MPINLLERIRPVSVDTENFVEKLVELKRVTKVVKGGRRFSFSALVVVGDGNGHFGIGFGKANDVSDAIGKATARAKKNVYKVNLKGSTIPHEVVGEFSSSRVVLKPAAPGTGVIAGSAVRPILEVVGVKDVLTKILGSKTKINVLKATANGLLSLMDYKEVAKLRGKSSVKELFE